MVKRIIPVVLAILFITTACQDSSSPKKNTPTPPPNTATFLQDVKDKMGGVNKVKTIQSVAVCSNDQEDYTLTIHSAPGDYCFFHQEYNNSDKEATSVIRDKFSGAWLMPDGSVRQWLQPNTITAIKSHEFHKMVWQPETFFNDLQITGEADVASHSCYMLRGTDQLGNQALLFFRKDTYLPVMYETQNPLAPEMKATLLFDRWETVNGMQAPGLVRLVQQQSIYEFDFTDVKVNAAGFNKVNLN